MWHKIILAVFSFALVSSAFADVVCGKVTLKNGKAKFSTQTLATTTCPKGFTLILDTSKVAVTVTGPTGLQGATGLQGTTGPQGITGSDGVDGQLRVYGDGSAGASVQASNVTLALDNLQFTDFTVNAGATLTVQSGTVIRCTGTFTNNGTINVQVFAVGSNSNLLGQLATTVEPAYRGVHPGIARSSAGDAEFGDSTSGRVGGDAGAGIGNSNRISVRSLLVPGPVGGGGGGAHKNGLGGTGGRTFSVLCAGGVIDNGTIKANGSTSGFAGGGGGGGGLVVLASKTSVSVGSSAIIEAKGANGTSASASVGTAGGGGGGGLIDLLAPSISVATPGNLSVAGGTAGSAVTVTINPRSGGGGGGGSIGNGGGGATVDTNGTATSQPAGPGTVGLILTDLVDPTALL